MVTKVFLINFLAMMTVAGIDKLILDNRIENSKYLIYLIGLWSYLTLLSIPIWLGYIIFYW